jgi:hypothetical protein
MQVGCHHINDEYDWDDDDSSDYSDEDCEEDEACAESEVPGEPCAACQAAQC